MLVTTSAVFFALAGTFTRSIDAGAWTIACWRGLVGSAIIAAYVLWRGRGPGMLGRLRLGRRGWMLALVSALSSIAFITAFKLTYVANVTIIYATVAFGASFAAAVILWTEGTRLVSAAESGLLGSAEVPLAIIFAWLFLGELAPAASLVGGGVVIVALFGYAAREFRRKPGLPES